MVVGDKAGELEELKKCCSTLVGGGFSRHVTVACVLPFFASADAFTTSNVRISQRRPTGTTIPSVFPIYIDLLNCRDMSALGKRKVRNEDPEQSEGHGYVHGLLR